MREKCSQINKEADSITSQWCWHYWTDQDASQGQSPMQTGRRGKIDANDLKVESQKPWLRDKAKRHADMRMVSEGMSGLGEAAHNWQKGLSAPLNAY